jgi:tetratricopeptide (TPR) repeat protein
MRKPLSPLEALQADAASAAARQVDLGAALGDWVAAAQLSCELAARYGALAELPADLDALVERDALLRAVQARPTMVHDGADPPHTALGTTAERLRVLAEAMEQSGCFELALTTVSAVCRLTARTESSAHALATLHLGRIARQMNALEAAEDAYASAIARALHLREPPIAARGYIGLALVADMRGNLPAAAEHYREALRLAVPRGGAYRQALQGLMSLAVTRNDLGEALVLGWTIYDASTDDVDDRHAALSELSLVALKAGFPAQARAGFRVVLGSHPRTGQRLATLGGDARAAAALEQHGDVARIAQEIEQEVARGDARYTATMTYLHLAEAQHLIGEHGQAEATLARARELAARFGYHEYTFAADALESRWNEAPSPNAEASLIVSSVEVSEAIERFATLA